MGIRESFDHVGKMPHRSSAGDSRLDARLESELGRLFFAGRITQREYEAGVRYANIVLVYLKSIDAPEPYGGEVESISDDECFARKMAFCSARAVVGRYAPTVDRIAVYDEPIRGDNDLEALRRGLKALAGLS